MATTTPTTRKELSQEQGLLLVREADLFVDWVLLWLARRELEEHTRVRKPPAAPAVERVELGA